MGMSTHITGFISDTDPTYQKHKKVLVACIEAGISELPKETAEYFGNKYPEEYLLEDKLSVAINKHEYSSDYEQGFEVYLKDIPQGVEKIRFVNSW